MGPGGERLVPAVAHRHRVSPFGHDAGEARHDESWNVWLIFITFLLSIFGTFLTRSGMVSSVHAFAQSAIGHVVLGSSASSSPPACSSSSSNRDHLKRENKLESLVSRESSFLFNNLVLLAACFAVLWGTLFPMLSEACARASRSRSARRSLIMSLFPLDSFCCFLPAIGPLLAWRSTSFDSVKQKFCCARRARSFHRLRLLTVGGMKPWVEWANFYSVMAISLSVLVFASITSEFYRGARVIRGHSDLGWFASVVQLTRRNTRRYGGYLVHYGVIVICIGFAGAAFNQTNEQELGFKDKMTIGPYTLICQNYTRGRQSQLRQRDGCA